MNKKIPVLVLFGPTASGKTKLAVEICKEFGGEVVTADSMQVYKRMNIGTAKPDEEEQCGVKHHMIDVVEPDVNYSLADYNNDAKKVIEDIYSRGKLPVLAGGTGLYIDTLIGGIRLSEGETDLEYRNELYKLAEEKGNEYVHSMLEQIDEQSAMEIHPNNVKRVIRALEQYKVSKVTRSEHIKNSHPEDTPFDTVKFCISLDREYLYGRINKRVDMMFENGLADEVEGLVKEGIDLSCTSMQGIGYKETVEYLSGRMSLDETKDLIKQSTRRYAKRQITWFKREKDTEFIEPDIKKVKEIVKNYGKNSDFIVK